MAKPLVMIGLLVVVVGSGGAGSVVVALAVAVALSLLGDIFLLPQVDRFVPGLAAFLAAHVAYSLALIPRAASMRSGAIGFAAGVVLVVLVGRRIIRGAACQHRSLAAPVAVYMAALVLLLFGGVATNDSTIVFGVVAFVASDAILGWNRFVEPLPHGRLVTHVLYHCGQTAIVAGALW